MDWFMVEFTSNMAEKGKHKNINNIFIKQYLFLIINILNKYTFSMNKTGFRLKNIRTNVILARDRKV